MPGTSERLAIISWVRYGGSPLRELSQQNFEISAWLVDVAYGWTVSVALRVVVELSPI